MAEAGKSLGYNEQALRMCIDGADGDKVWGRVFSMRLSQPVDFTDLSDFVMKMDAIMDAQNFPQSFQRKRAFKVPAGRSREAHLQAALEGEAMTEAEVEAANGLCATLVVRVLARQNASWQGHVAMPGHSGLVDFSSELDFVEIVLASLRG